MNFSQGIVFYWRTLYSLVLYVLTARCCANGVHVVVVYLSVRLCVCVSVTLRYYVKTAKRRITQIIPYNRDIL